MLILICDKKYASLLSSSNVCGSNLPVQTHAARPKSAVHPEGTGNWRWAARLKSVTISACTVSKAVVLRPAGLAGSAADRNTDRGAHHAELSRCGTWHAVKIRHAGITRPVSKTVALSDGRAGRWQHRRIIAASCHQNTDKRSCGERTLR